LRAATHAAVNTFFLFFFIWENPTFRKEHFVGPSERVKPWPSQALTRDARPDSNSRPAVQIPPKSNHRTNFLNVKKRRKKLRFFLRLVCNKKKCDKNQSIIFMGDNKLSWKIHRIKWRVLDFPKKCLKYSFDDFDFKKYMKEWNNIKSWMIKSSHFLTTCGDKWLLSNIIWCKKITRKNY